MLLLGRAKLRISAVVAVLALEFFALPGHAIAAPKRVLLLHSPRPGFPALERILEEHPRGIIP
jgi:hypothetical protein